MQLSFKISSPQFSGMVPLKNYKGPILKLTPKEEQKIAGLQENINRMEFEIYNLNKIYGSKSHLRVKEFNYYVGRVEKLTLMIDDLKQMIRDIKVKRFNKQKEQFK